jgi:putative ABC transport system permease protein
MGATSGTLLAQFMAEALITALLAAMIGLALCELALPMVNAAGGLALKLDYLSPEGTALPVLITVVLLGVGAGVYPALILSRFQPAAVLASARTPGGGRAGARVREILVAAQFAIAIAFTIGAGVIVSQTTYLRHADIGFRRDGLIVVNSFDDSEVSVAQRRTLLSMWGALPGVAAITAADIAPGNNDNTNASNFKRPGTPGDGPSVNYVTSQPRFFETYGARLVAGRFLDRNHGGDDAPPPTPAGVKPPPVKPNRNIVINEGAVKTLGFKDAAAAIGQTVLSGRDDNSFDPTTVVGVIRDIRFRSPHAPVPATIYFMGTRSFEGDVVGVRYAGADPRVVMDRMSAEWRQIVPADPFRAKTVEENLGRYYRPDDQHGRLFTTGAVLAVAIGCLGLYGLASFTTARRAREIGIRKTLGASTGEVLRLLVSQFVRPVVLANLLAWPLAWAAMRSWLASFDQRIALTPAFFLSATLLTLFVALATVTGHAYAVARVEPAKALREE